MFKEVYEIYLSRKKVLDDSFDDDCDFDDVFVFVNSIDKIEKVKSNILVSLGRGNESTGKNENLIPSNGNVDITKINVDDLFNSENNTNLYASTDYDVYDNKKEYINNIINEIAAHGYLTRIFIVCSLPNLNNINCLYETINESNNLIFFNDCVSLDGVSNYYVIKESLNNMKNLNKQTVAISRINHQEGKFRPIMYFEDSLIIEFAEKEFA